jgi:hypothetical protein
VFSLASPSPKLSELHTWEDHLTNNFCNLQPFETYSIIKNYIWSRVPVAHAYILATQEAEIRRNAVQSQPGKIVLKTISQKTPIQKNWAGGVVQGVGSEFKLTYLELGVLIHTYNPSTQEAEAREILSPNNKTKQNLASFPGS